MRCPGVANLSPGLIPDFRDLRSVGVSGDVCASQMIAEEVFYRHALRDGKGRKDRTVYLTETAIHDQHQRQMAQGFQNLTG
jgi:hypothetical protein